MTPLSRETWAPRIRLAALAWGVGFASSQEIDSLGILPATKLAATRALASLSASPPSPSPSSFSPALSLTPFHPLPLSLLLLPSLPDYLLTDYLIFPNLDLPQPPSSKATGSPSALPAPPSWPRPPGMPSCARPDSQYPGYGFARHKGYGTRLHQQSIRQLGLCEIHRKSFSIHY